MPDSTSFQITPAKQFLALVKEANLTTQKVASINGTIGERIQHAVENAHLHRTAFGLIRKLARMDEDKRDAFLRNFDSYRDIVVEAGLFGSEHVGDLAEMAEGQAAAERLEEMQAEDAQTAANVEALKANIRPLTPQVELADAFEAGRIAFLNNEGGVIPDGLSAKVGESWLDGWRSVQLLTVEERAALKGHGGAEVESQVESQVETEAETSAEAAPEPFEDDATAKTPSRRRGRKAADVGDAPGSYALTH